MYKVEMRSVSGITEHDRRRRMHQAYEILLSTARKKRNDAPASKAGEPGASAPSDVSQSDQRQGHATPEYDLKQAEEGQAITGKDNAARRERSIGDSSNDQRRTNIGTHVEQSQLAVGEQSANLAKTSRLAQVADPGDRVRSAFEVGL